MSTLSYGLNITKKPPLGTRPPPAQRKTIFDDESGPEDGPDEEGENLETISTIGGVQPPTKRDTSTRPSAPSSRPSKAPKFSQYGDLSAQHTSSKHYKTAQDLDPNIYDYDAVYDSLHAKTGSTTSHLDTEKKPKYMGNLLAAAEIRKRDQLRAKEKMLAKEREAEGDEFADKEKFVTGAYKRQQEEMRKLGEEESIRERETEERKRREGGGLKALYKNMLERDETKHKEIMKAVEDKKRGKESPARDGEREHPKDEEDLAKAKGVTVNEDGQIVDKRQLLQAGLNAGAASKSKVPPDRRTGSSQEGRGRQESARERETRLFEEQLLGRGSMSSDDEDDHDSRE